jgi:hypothetical protein
MHFTLYYVICLTLVQRDTEHRPVMRALTLQIDMILFLNAVHPVPLTSTFTLSNFLVLTLPCTLLPVPLASWIIKAIRHHYTRGPHLYPFSSPMTRTLHAGNVFTKTLHCVMSSNNFHRNALICPPLSGLSIQSH